MAEVPVSNDLYSDFDISLLDNHLYPNGETSYDEAKVFQNVINHDVSLTTNWLNALVDCSQDKNNQKIDFGADDMGEMEEYSDTESQVGGSSAVPSPAFVDHHKSFEFINDKELTKISVKELNKRLKNLPKPEVEKLKKRRRTLKNRRYAHSCRMKRIHEKNTLESTKEDLETALREARQELQKVTQERDTYKAHCEKFYKFMQSQRV